MAVRHHILTACRTPSYEAPPAGGAGRHVLCRRETVCYCSFEKIKCLLPYNRTRPVRTSPSYKLGWGGGPQLSTDL